MQALAKPKKWASRSGTGRLGSRRIPSTQAVTATKWATATWTGQRWPGRRTKGRIDIVIGRNRSDETQIATASAGSAAPLKRPANRITCAGAAHIRHVDSTAAPAGRPASRARLPTPKREKPTIQAG